MKPQEAIQYAQALPEASVYAEHAATLAALRALEETASPRALRLAAEKLLSNAEAFRRSDAPGHTIHYPGHLRAAACGCSRWADKIEGAAQHARR